jgi:hypothetical protein
MDMFGVEFVNYTATYGYDKMLQVLGRHMRDFLNGLDNLHEYLKFSYPKLRPPSFFVEEETSNGLILHYRTKRKGFVHYVMGQIRQVSIREQFGKLSEILEFQISFRFFFGINRLAKNFINWTWKSLLKIKDLNLKCCT